MFNSVSRRILLGVLLLLVGTVLATTAHAEIQWSESVEESLSKAAETGKPIMMDFYTDW